MHHAEFSFTQLAVEHEYWQGFINLSHVVYKQCNLLYTYVLHIYTYVLHSLTAEKLQDHSKSENIVA